MDKKVIFGILVLGIIGLSPFAFAGVPVDTVVFDGIDTQGDCEDFFPNGLEGTFDGTTCTLQVPVDLQIEIMVDNFTLDCNHQIIQSPMAREGIGIAVIESKNVKIKNCIINKFQNNILIDNSNNNMVFDNVVNNAENFGISLVNSNGNMIMGNSGTINGVFLDLVNSNLNTVEFNEMNHGEIGMEMDNSNGNTIQHNYISHNLNFGFQIFGSSNNIIFDNLIKISHLGLRLENSDGNQILENEMERNLIGLIIYGSDRNLIFENLIHNNSGDGFYLVNNSNENQVRGNIIDSNMGDLSINGHYGLGILIGSTDSNTIFENQISNNNNQGIGLFSLDKNFIYNNNFIGNNQDGTQIVGAIGQEFNLPLPLGGNYYSTYDEASEGCIDVDPENGFCDDPLVFGSGQDNFPWTIPSGWLDVIPPESNGGGGMEHQTRPTFGIHHGTFETVVDTGFKFNNQTFPIVDNFHTPFAEQSVKIGETNSVSATVYAEKGLKIQEFLFGIPVAGQAHLAELGVEVWYDVNGEIKQVKAIQKSNVIDKKTLVATNEKTKCQASDKDEKCDTTNVSMVFLEPLKDKVMALKAIDYKERYQITYLNEGVNITGESLNPMNTFLIPSNIKGEGLLQVTQTEKYSAYWIAEDGRVFEKNDFDSFKHINHTFERFEDTGNPYTRLHSGFGGIIAYEQKRATQVFDSSEFTSELPESFAYVFPEPHERVSKEMKKEMLEQEAIAKKIIEESKVQTRW